MKKNELIQSIKVIMLGLVLSLCIGFVSASNWAPTGAPSVGTNVDGPLNTGPSAQTKAGNLTVSGTFVAGNAANVLSSDGLATNAFVATGHSVFASKVYVGGFPGSGSTFEPVVGTNSKPSFLAKISESLGFANEVSAEQVQSGTYDWNTAPALTVGGDTKITTLVGTGERSLCADATGLLKVCGAGTCGTANGQVFNSAPTTNLCATGTASSTSTGNAPWTWTCTLNAIVGNCSTALASAGSQTFTSNGTFTVPTGVTKVYVKAVGGGGGGGGAGAKVSNFAAGSPGIGSDTTEALNSKFNGYLVAVGGKGGGGGDASNTTSCSSVGTGGQGGYSGSGQTGDVPGTSGDSGSASSTVTQNAKGGYSGAGGNPGTGGKGGGPTGVGSCQGGGGGGSSAIVTAREFSVSGGSNISIIVGKGGAGGAGGSGAQMGYSGSDGYVIVSW